MKIEKFIIDYAKYKKDVIKSSVLIESNIKKELINRIEKAVKCRQCGLITVDEAIKMILGNEGEIF